MDLFGKRASGALAVTKNRGGPVTGRGEEVAIGDTKEVAMGRGVGTAAGSDDRATVAGREGNADGGDVAAAVEDAQSLRETRL
ncbi:hypothetical protein GCM10011574_55990 [Microbispora bryophytorum]|uniref:Uncharacterized protein n=1 Tax=Microbispora bryophytorum TaxID=1460882 RepID=A0A8H9H6A5_9ACTN|nr:hypothetical protein GCM10011574_55990 [Microbispora bryophytorum]